MKTINILTLSVLTLFALNASGQEITSQKGNDDNKVLLNCSFGAGTFAAGENMGGSVFLGSSLSADWIPNQKKWSFIWT